MYRILIAVILLLGMTQQTFAYTLTTRDERTADRLINGYELKIDREGDELRPLVLTQLEHKLARFQRIGAYRLAAIYTMVIKELREDTILPETPIPVSASFTISTSESNTQYSAIGNAKIGSITIRPYNGTIMLRHIDILHGGSGRSSDIDTIWLEYNGVRVTTQSSINSNNHATLSFLKDVYLSSDTGMSNTFDLIVKSSKVDVQEYVKHSFSTKKECIALRGDNVFSCNDGGNLLSIGSVIFKNQYIIPSPVIIKASYQFTVDGVEKSTFTNISRDLADYYCQKERKSYPHQAVACIWNNITLYKEEAIKRLYQGYIDGKIFVTTEQITKSEALKNCLLNFNSNSQSSVRCVWNGIEIYSRKAPTPTVIQKPYISLENLSRNLGTITANAGEETKLLSYTISNNGQARLHISAHDIQLVLSDSSAKKSDFILTTRANGEIIDISNGASSLGNGFNLEKYKNIPISVAVTTPKTYSGTVKLILNSVSENDIEGGSGGGTYEASFQSNIATFKPLIIIPPATQSLKMSQIAGSVRPFSTTNRSLGIWKYQALDNVSPYTTKFHINTSASQGENITIELFINGKFITSFTNPPEDLFINGGEFGILSKNTNATLEFKIAQDSLETGKNINIKLIEVEYGDNTGDGKTLTLP